MVIFQDDLLLVETVLSRALKTDATNFFMNKWNSHMSALLNTCLIESEFKVFQESKDLRQVKLVKCGTH